MMENKKKKIFCGAAVLLIIIATCSTVDASFVKMSSTNVSNEIEKIHGDDKIDVTKFTTSNDFNDSLNSMYETIEESGLLYGNHKTALMKYIGNLLNMSVSDLKEIMNREINEVILRSDNDLIKNEIEDGHKELIKEMEARDVTDEMRFLEIVDCAGSILSYGYGYAYFTQSKQFPSIPGIWISGPLIAGGYWEYTDDSGATAVHCVNDKTLYDIRGPQYGRVGLLLGFAIGYGATAWTQGTVVIFGFALVIRVRQFSTELPVSEDFEERSKYNRKEYIENACDCEPMLNKQDKAGMVADYLEAYEQDVKPLASFYQTPYDPHEPIHINGNNDFKKPVEENGVIGGCGTIDDPYIIENWDINAESVTGILIENTDAYFIINNCYIHNGDVNDKSGIIFKQVKHGRIRNCNVSGNDNGIFLFNSTANKVTDCSFFGNEVNIYLNKAKNNKIIGCTSKDSGFGIWNVYDSSNNHIINCDFQNNLLGMAFLFSSSNNYVTDCNISRNSFGILSIFSWDNKINFNNICNNGNGQLFIGMLTLGSIENATNNWWGSTDGPGGKGPGCGDAISWIRGNIAFEPWLTEPI